MIGRFGYTRTMFHHLQSSVIPGVAPNPCSEVPRTLAPRDLERGEAVESMGLVCGLESSLHVPMFLYRFNRKES
jgi:hypothetical protein